MAALSEVVDVLAARGVSARQDDGTLRQINLSRPTGPFDVFVIGLRYVKRDKTHTEDHFVSDGAHPTQIERCYRGTLDEMFPEYRGTHKQPGDFDVAQTFGGTLVNTVTFNIPRL